MPTPVTTDEIKEVIEIIHTTWKGLLLSAGMSSGIFARLSEDTPVTAADLREQSGFDEKKLLSWLDFMERNRFLIQASGFYTLSAKGSLLIKSSSVKDLYGLANLTEYYALAAVQARDCFRKGLSLDKLSEGKISRDYQPKVSDQFSKSLIVHFKEHRMLPKDSVLDIGCGNGSFLRNFTDVMPDLQLYGVDSNMFAIELGKKENKAMGCGESIHLRVGDVTTDMTEYPQDSYDWVTAINLFHFVPVAGRRQLIDHMIRIARKGIFMNEAIIEPSPVTAAGNPLMALLYNDFTGFFKEAEADQLNRQLALDYPNLQ